MHNDIKDVDSLYEINYSGSDKKIKDVLTELISKLGENIVIKDLLNFQIITNAFKNTFTTQLIKTLVKLVLY